MNIYFFAVFIRIRVLREGESYWKCYSKCLKASKVWWLAQGRRHRGDQGDLGLPWILGIELPFP